MIAVVNKELVYLVEASFVAGSGERLNVEAVGKLVPQGLWNVSHLGKAINGSGIEMESNLLTAKIRVWPIAEDLLDLPARHPDQAGLGFGHGISVPFAKMKKAPPT